MNRKIKKGVIVSAVLGTGNKLLATGIVEHNFMNDNKYCVLIHCFSIKKQATLEEIDIDYSSSFSYKRWAFVDNTFLTKT